MCAPMPPRCASSPTSCALPAATPPCRRGWNASLRSWPRERNISEALANPNSPKDDAFANLRIGAEELAAGLKDPIAFIDVLADRYIRYPISQTRRMYVPPCAS
jgi:hypothetical protein